MTSSNPNLLHRDGLPRLGLRAGWKDLLGALSLRGVPTYIFSSGYGDVVAQALLLSGLGSFPSAASPPPVYHPQGQGHVPGAGQQLPANLRIISNFFRTAPDGSVRAFSQPAVHERNKNASTAARVLGMPLPTRPYALLLAAHEDDASAMLDGLKDSLRESISVGQSPPSLILSYLILCVWKGSWSWARNCRRVCRPI